MGCRARFELALQDSQSRVLTAERTAPLLPTRELYNKLLQFATREGRQHTRADNTEPRTPHRGAHYARLWHRLLSFAGYGRYGTCSSAYLSEVARRLSLVWARRT